ncbi:helix-turn-helix domain-containing protein [Allorhodopirellula solitaria]|uniref:Transcriptional regulator EutR n=1 Tax=Allorhodopirellula solitaria TaxID=2527987 RepID=A0A5C5XS37_9BACT|nr:helix-turn-helix domain-containing protein [Allorhodopirellula solitaria]TWT66017.1 transcriptional regulator EutR [Allorhodopirellula solitaria]
MANRVTKPFVLEALLDQTGLRERAMQRFCKEVYGLSPKQLFGVTRLNRVRRELLQRDDRSTSIRTLAEKWGVAHLGRFSADYRKLFGELPHETFQRHSDS